MQLIVYTKPNCHFCHMMADLLDHEFINYKEVDITEDKVAEALLKEHGHKTVPQVYLGTRSLGGYNKVSSMVVNNTLEELLKSAESPLL